MQNCIINSIFDLFKAYYVLLKTYYLLFNPYFYFLFEMV